VRAQIRARSWMQILSLVLLLAVGVVAFVLLSTGHAALGSALTGLFIVALMPFIVWMRATRLAR